jgi:putative transposase
MDRLVLSEEQWMAIAPAIIGRPHQPGSTGGDSRGGVVDRPHGAPWRDLPEIFGNWNSAFRRFSRWSAKGIWERIFMTLCDDPDFEYLIIDSTIVRVHQHGYGAKRGAEAQAIGRSARDMLNALIEGQILLADRASDSDEIRQSLAERGHGLTSSPCRTAKTCRPSAHSCIAIAIWSSASSVKSNITELSRPDLISAPTTSWVVSNSLHRRARRHLPTLGQGGNF